MTPLLCATYCSQFSYFGVEYGRECWCGPKLNSNSSLVSTQSDCNMPCSGDVNQICGAASRLSVYRSSDPSKASADPVVPGNTIGNYSYAGCVADSGTPRLLGQVMLSDAMSNEACVAVAEMQQAVYAGTEYGSECWTGNVLVGGNGTVAGVRVAEGECRMSCSGARKEVCGGPARVNVWVRNGGW